MLQTSHVYWKRDEDSDALYLAGHCHRASLSPNTHLGTKPLPTEIITTCAEDGTIEAISPPVLGGHSAYRYRLILTPRDRTEIPTMTDFRLSNLLSVQKIQGPHPEADRENWWWYAEDNFSPLGYTQKTPLRLIKKWKRGMLEILLENHPERDERLAEWDRRLEVFKSVRKRSEKPRIPTIKRADNDLVVLPNPVPFEDDAIRQVFLYKIQSGGYLSRAKHTLEIRGVPHQTPHSRAMPVRDGIPPHHEFTPPMKTALTLLAWARAPRLNSHDLMRSEKKFAREAEDAILLMEDWIAARDTYSSSIPRHYHIAAAMNALRDFMPTSAPADLSPRARADVDRVIASAKAVIETLQAEIQIMKERRVEKDPA